MARSIISDVGDLFNRSRRIAKSRLVMDAAALAAVAAAANLAQLITLPHLTRVLGPTEWGLTAWTIVITGYFVIIVDWGFSWRGTARIAALRHSHDELSKVFIAGWSIQVLLAFLSAAVITTLVHSVPTLAPFRPFALYVGCLLVAGALFPIWLPFGLERTRELALVQFASRVGSVPLIFIFVREPTDGPIVLAAMALSQMVASLLGLIWMLRNFKVDWHWPHRDYLRIEFLEGGTVVLTRIWPMLYTTFIPSVLGTMMSTAMLGFYLLSDRIRGGVIALISPLVQALLPRMSYLVNHYPSQARRLLLRSFAVIGVISGVFSVILFVFAEPIIITIGGPTFKSSVPILRCFALLPLITFVSNTLGIQMLIPSGRIYIYNRVLIAAGCVSAVLVFPLIRLFGLTGGAITMLIGETITAVLMGVYVWLRRDLILPTEA